MTGATTAVQVVSVVAFLLAWLGNLTASMMDISIQNQCKKKKQRPVGPVNFQMLQAHGKNYRPGASGRP